MTTIQKLQSQPVGERPGTEEVLHQYYTASIPVLVPRHDRRRTILAGNVHLYAQKRTNTSGMTQLVGRRAVPLGGGATSRPSKKF